MKFSPKCNTIIMSDTGKVVIKLGNFCQYTAAPLYRGPIDRVNGYNAVVLCRPLLIKKKFKKKKLIADIFGAV